MEENDRKYKGELKNILRKFFDVKCIVKYAFKFTAHDSPYYIMDNLFIIILEFDATVWKIEDGNIQIKEYTGHIIGYDTI